MDVKSIKIHAVPINLFKGKRTNLLYSLENAPLNPTWLEILADLEGANRYANGYLLPWEAFSLEEILSVVNGPERKRKARR